MPNCVDIRTTRVHIIRVRRAASIPLILWFLLLGTGAVGYLHQLDHEHREAACAGESESSGQPSHPTPAHDAGNCLLHAQLQMPLLTAHWVPLLIALGLFVAFLTMLSRGPALQRVPVSIDCRGPPAC